MVDIGAALAGANESHAYGVNDSGQVVGWYLDAAGHAQGFLWHDGDVIAPLGDLGGGEAKAYAINDHGLITGSSRLASGAWHAFLRGGPDPSGGGS